MLRLYHVLLGLILLALAPIGVQLARSHFDSTSKSDSKQVIQPAAVNTPPPKTAVAPNPNSGNIWKSILGKTTAPPEWRVTPCEKTGSLLCVSTKGQILGTVELGFYPLGQQYDFQKMLKAVGITPGAKVDYQSPKYQTQISTALKTWIAQHYADVSKDRLLSYGDRISFSPQPPEKVFFGKLQGMRYGFAGVNQKGGAVQEQNLGYIAFDGTALYVITTAFDPSSVTGKFDTLENFQRFEPHLSTIVAGLKLPQ